MGTTDDDGWNSAQRSDVGVLTNGVAVPRPLRGTATPLNRHGPDGLGSWWLTTGAAAVTAGAVSAAINEATYRLADAVRSHAHAATIAVIATVLLGVTSVVIAALHLSVPALAPCVACAAMCTTLLTTRAIAAGDIDIAAELGQALLASGVIVAAVAAAVHGLARANATQRHMRRGDESV